MDWPERHARKLAQTGCPKCPECKYRLTLDEQCAECFDREQNRKRHQTATA